MSEKANQNNSTLCAGKQKGSPIRRPVILANPEALNVFFIALPDSEESIWKSSQFYLPILV